MLAEEVDASEIPAVAAPFPPPPPYNLSPPFNADQAERFLSALAGRQLHLYDSFKGPAFANAGHGKVC
jgi:hypothetical protein